MRNILLAAAAVSVIAAPAFAQTMQGPTYYGTLGYSQLDHSDGDLGAVTGRVGAKFNPYLGVEGEASIGVKDDDFTFAGVDGKIEHDYDAAAYVVGTLPVTPNFELFARGGYGTTKIKTELAGFDGEVDGESWNYGAGANYYLDGQNGLRADWTRRDFRDDAGEADVYSLSYVRRF
ncbi:MAG: porin family protein [Brevundimonas sp.]|uniref:Porin family protein n=1 Tax=Brevundimonas albigilva TaxID=1312364 RepID=A0ABY4SS80_9CAUL|nr:MULTISPECIES: porin family protein [Brevundimonas]MCV0415648.1 porin family protein [Brevundimonas sp.]PZU60697.1 MAG: porin family protein [Brevundimonas sp.]UQV19184.1 porin family protein [Brevundimonas albigilva]URI15939.1 porin family protein [Brevundimonas albigilva]